MPLDAEAMDEQPRRNVDDMIVTIRSVRSDTLPHAEMQMVSMVLLVAIKLLEHLKRTAHEVAAEAEAEGRPRGALN